MEQLVEKGGDQQVRRLCWRAIAVSVAVAMVAAGLLPGLGTQSAWAQGEITLTATGLAASYLVRQLVDTADKTQTVINAAVEAAVSGLTPIEVTLSNGTGTDYSGVRIAPVNAGPHIQLWAKDTVGNWYDINAVGWGPTEGFTVSANYSATTDVYLIADAAETYPLTVKLVDASNPQNVIAQASANVIVRSPVPMAVTAQVPTFVVGQPAEFTVTTVANDDAGKLVRAYFTVPEGVLAEYYEVNDGKWYPLPNVYGPETGFPVADATSRFRAPSVSR